MSKPESTGQAEQAVERFNQAKEELDSFLADPEIRDVMLEFQQLVTNHNNRLDEALRATKAELRSSARTRLVYGSIGAMKKFKRYYDVDYLAAKLPAEQADEILTEKVVYELHQERLDQLLRQGEIDTELVQQAYHEEEQNPSNLPGVPKPFTIPTVVVD
jgi:hypothetical protein